MAAPMRQLISSRFLTVSRRNWRFCQGRYFALHSIRYAVQSDIRKVFINDEVQSILKRITGFDLHRINAPQLQDLQESKVQLLTDEQLQQVTEAAKQKAEAQLVMPPVMNEREEIQETLSEDPEIADAIQNKIVFTDVTFGIPDRERICVIRETDGVLRSASWAERERMQQIYFPQEGKRIRPPKIFDNENLQLMLNEGRYLYALERTCLQFEPDDPNFINVTEKIYDHILSQKQFNHLRSSRHFGPMAFYFARYNKIDQLVLYLLGENELDSAADAVRLLHIMHSELPSAVRAKEQNVTDYLQLVEMYCEMDAIEKGPMSLLLQSHKEQKAEV